MLLVVLVPHPIAFAELEKNLVEEPTGIAVNEEHKDVVAGHFGHRNVVEAGGILEMRGVVGGMRGV